MILAANDSRMLHKTMLLFVDGILTVPKHVVLGGAGGSLQCIHGAEHKDISA